MNLDRPALYAYKLNLSVTFTPTLFLVNLLALLFIRSGAVNYKFRPFRNEWTWI